MKSDINALNLMKIIIIGWKDFIFLVYSSQSIDMRCVCIYIGAYVVINIIFLISHQIRCNTLMFCSFFLNETFSLLCVAFLSYQSLLWAGMFSSVNARFFSIFKIAESHSKYYLLEKCPIYIIIEMILKL